jgi:DMSO/TMAO reductase YedYZ molybdopterin-dependent catalytic subunit
VSVLKQLGTPVFYVEGVPEGITPENYRLDVSGLVRTGPASFTFAQLEAMPLTTVNARLTSVSGWTVRADWQGVCFRDFEQRLDVEPKATHVSFQSFGAYTTCLPLKELRYEKVLLCYKVAGEYLEPEYGAPVRLFVPQLWGYKSIKGLRRMEFMDHYVAGFWETRGYTDDAEIEPGTTLDVNTRTRRQIKGGEVTEF